MQSLWSSLYASININETRDASARLSLSEAEETRMSSLLS